jgi:hypothetical protein
MNQVAQEHSRHDAILHRILDLEVEGFGRLGLFTDIVVFKGITASPVVALLFVIAYL